MPLDVSPAAADSPATAPERIEYFRSYQFVFASPNWLINLLWGTVALLSSSVIPIVGPMVWTGYLYECVESLVASRGQRYPDFEFNRFGDYLARGVWPSLLQLVIWAILFLMYIAMYVGIFVIALLAASVGEEYMPIVFGIGGTLFGLAMSAILFVAVIWLAPATLRAGLSQDLAVALRRGSTRDFFRRVGMELLFTTLFLVVTGALVTTLGCAFFIFGSYPAWAWMTMASAHLGYQLYVLYLARGGQPIPLKPRPVPGIVYVPPVAAAPPTAAAAPPSPSAGESPR